ncbi:NAD-dependent epimerase/dehydratase family protein [Paludisphaera rhizosphaerae]|uniref:NAD-dependent epimerase/dehydratase family protein n=1 Tax=Paludisphaera rhizosphaerae TaxID=2711216 RepID=UPI0013EB37A4|nr:NAD-dependent epimerase/dehydratase family protein [Paludisphaera rhizosphaerae]
MSGLSTITGGAGFIGSHLVELLTSLGRAVRVVERPGADVSHLPSGVEVLFADVRRREGLADALRGSRFVYHLAANPNLWLRDRREFDAVNNVGAVNVLDAALEVGAERILHTSTESILTKENASGLIDEDVEIVESDAVGPYCLSKLRAENHAMKLAREGRPVVVANPTMPVGPGDRGPSPPTRLIMDFCRGALPAFIDCTLNLIDVRDVALGLLRVLEVGRPGRRYLLGAANLSLAELMAILSQITGIPAPRRRVPYAFGLGFAYLSEFWADHVTGKPPKASVTGVKLARRIMHFDVSRSLRELELTPRPIARSLADSVAWLQLQERNNR